MLFLLRDLAQSNSKDMETTTTTTMSTMSITDESSVLEPSPNGLYRLRPGLTLHLYCQTPPNTGPLLDDANGKSIQVLSCVRDGASLPSPSNQQSMTEMCHFPAIMSLADKMLKWNTLGVQGALLSTRIEPIFISSLAMGTLCDIEAVRHAVLERLPTTRSVEVAAVSAPIAARDPGVHCWSRNGDLFENLVAGRTTLGGCSRLSKAALFEMFHSIAPIELEQWEKYRTTKELEQYRTAKESAMIYGEGARQFRDELKRRGFGIWQTKPIAVDEFQMSSSDG